MEPKAIESQAMTLKEAAALMNCTTSWIRLLINRGDLWHQKVGKRFLVRRDEVSRVLERGWRKNGK